MGESSIREMKVLKDNVAVVVGAGGGIGRQISRRFLREGAVVAAVDRNLTILNTAFQDYHEGQDRLFHYAADIGQAAQVATLAKKIMAVHKQVDAVIICAAIQGPIGVSWKNEPRAWEETVRINLLGAWHCARYFLPPMVARKKGKMVFFSGGGAAYPRLNFSSYGCTKAAVVRLSEQLAEELKPFHVQVNAMAPGAVRSGMTQKILAAGRRAGAKEILEARKFMESGGTSPEKFTGLALFLCSAQSGTLTGKFLHVNDPWSQMKSRALKLNGHPFYTLRRVNPS